MGLTPPSPAVPSPAPDRLPDPMNATPTPSVGDDSPRSWSGARWVEAPLAGPALPRTDLLPAVARCLAVRGFDDPAWLSPSVDHLHDPLTMHRMDEAVHRLRRAVARQERLRVITDYDVDGTTSSLVLQAALQTVAPGLALDYHIPDRFTEGYGFSVTAAQKAAADGIGLVVTADIGVRDHAAVAAARAAGVDVLVCDHHLPPGADVPSEAIVLCPPQAADTYANRHLAACGVSYKLAEALLADHPRRDTVLASLRKLVAIGTVADLVPLATRENRALVALGVRELNEGRHAPGLAALLDVAGARPGDIDTATLGYQIGPRINAAGRLARATHVIELLSTRDPVEAAQLARELDALNRERRDLQDHLVDKVLRLTRDTDDPFVVVAGAEGDGWHRGIVGIVASRAKDELNRPVAVVSIHGELAVGSIRSVPSVHAVKALDTAADLLVRYGGHPAAAGFTVRTADLDRLRERLGAFAAAAGHDADARELLYDATLPPHEVDARLHAQLQQLAPFGMGNPEPRLVVRDARLVDITRVGAKQQHLKARLSGSQGPVEVVAWSQGALAGRVGEGPVDLLGSIGENRWKGRRTLQLVVHDARPARGR